MSEQEQTRLNKKQEDVVVIYHLRIKEGRLSGLMRWYAVSTFLSVSASTAIGREYVILKSSPSVRFRATVDGRGNTGILSSRSSI